MALNYIWIAFFLIGFVVGIIRLLVGWFTSGDVLNDAGVFDAMMQSTFDMSKTGFEIALGLTGVLTLWSGIMKIGENAGAVTLFAKWFSPVFKHIFPDVPKGHPAAGSIMMNFSANMLGLDNAATPLGLKAMEQLQELNPKKDTASNAQIMFLVLNTSGLTLIPVSIMGLRAAQQAENPADVFLPILLATFVSTLVALFVVSAYQRINLFKPAVLLFLFSLLAFVAGFIKVIFYLSNGDPERLAMVSKLAAALIIFSIIIFFILLAVKSKSNVYESFIEGAKDGFQTAIRIIPYLVAMLVAIGVFKASGSLDYIVDGIRFAVAQVGNRTEFVDALPTAIMRPLSGSGSRALMVETWQNSGVDVMCKSMFETFHAKSGYLIEWRPAIDQIVSRMTSTIQGSTETTFYTIAVYYGAVQVKKIRHTLVCGLIADGAGITAAITLCYLFF